MPELTIEQEYAGLLAANVNLKRRAATAEAERDKAMLQNRVYGDQSIEAARLIDELRSERDEARRQLAEARSALDDTLEALRGCARYIDMVHITELDFAERAEIKALAVLDHKEAQS